MKGLGTIINVGCIVAGGICGLLFGRKLLPRMRETLMSVTGVAVLFLGIGGALEKMLYPENGVLASGGTMMMIVSLSVGAIIGELLNLEDGVTRFGEWLKRKSGSDGDNTFVNSFVAASCTVCIGAMAVVGAIEDGIHGDFSILLAKGILDAIIICIMTAAQGKGCIFSAIPVALFQGTITVVAMLVGSFMTQAAMNDLSFVGSILIFCVGMNLVWDTIHIRVANLLPAIVIAAAWSFLV